MQLRYNLVEPTRTGLIMPTTTSRKSTSSKAVRAKPAKKAGSAALPGRWPLQAAKTRFSELVRKAQEEGPQHVTVHGRDSVVVLSEAEYARLKGGRTGQDLIDLFANSPLKDVNIIHPPVYGPVRDIDLD
jgi:prevent-host-death family protein